MAHEKTEAAGGSLAGLIDHTLLKPDATEAQIRELCDEAREYRFASVCVNSCRVRLCRDCLKDSGVVVCTVVGFPLGAATSETKAFEAALAVNDGAQEVDMVVNVGAVKSGDYSFVKSDIQAVKDATNGRALLKVILETCLLTDDEKRRVCAVCKEVGVDFVKTSTGFSTGGATVEDIRLMRAAVGSEMGVKASGGVRSAATARAMVEAGATRLGTSSGVAIVKEDSGADSL